MNMANKDDDRTPDKVTHHTAFVIGHKPTVDVVVVHKDHRTYTGVGWDHDAANKHAGAKYERGEADKK
jgi:hypothetical protein